MLHKRNSYPHSISGFIASWMVSNLCSGPRRGPCEDTSTSATPWSGRGRGPGLRRGRGPGPGPGPRPGPGPGPRRRCSFVMKRFHTCSAAFGHPSHNSQKQKQINVPVTPTCRSRNLVKPTPLRNKKLKIDILRFLSAIAERNSRNSPGMTKENSAKSHKKMRYSSRHSRKPFPIVFPAQLEWV